MWMLLSIEAISSSITLSLNCSKVGILKFDENVEVIEAKN